MPAQMAQVDVLLRRIHYTLPGWNTATERRDAHGEFQSAVQARAWADGDFDAGSGFDLDGAGSSVRQSRGSGPSGAEAAAVRAPLLCESWQHFAFEQQ
jgi:hypothetical protein